MIKCCKTIALITFKVNLIKVLLIGNLFLNITNDLSENAVVISVKSAKSLCKSYCGIIKYVSSLFILIEIIADKLMRYHSTYSIISDFK